jgi:tetratricopeptide (TPR) repeat protein
MRTTSDPLKYAPVLAVSLFLCAVYVFAQSVGSGSITGRVLLPDGNMLNESVRVSLETMRGIRSSVYTDNQGQYVFRGLAPGIYQVVIDTGKSEYEVTSAQIEVFPNQPALLNIVLKEKRSTRSQGGIVSAAELDKIPTKAKKEFDRGSNASKEGKTEEAITHLRKAIELYPAYLMARNDLGALLLEQGRLPEAEVELRQAVSIDAKAFYPCLNLGIVLVQQQRFSEAVDMLRKALALEGTSPVAKLYLGQALAGLKDLTGAVQELKAAHELGGPAYAVALFRLGEIYLSMGDRQRALKAFERYLSEAPNAANAAEAQRLIGILK